MSAAPANASGVRLRHGSPHRYARPFLLASLGLIALVSLPPSGTSVPRGFDLCLVCGGVGAASAVLNVVLYLPLGASLWWRGRTILALITVGALVSFGVETAQLFIPGRHSALSDLLANTLGVGLGGVLAIRPSAWLRPPGPAGHAAATAAAAGMLLSGLLLQPTAPAGDYYGQWRPGSALGRLYDGAVVEARLGALPLPSARLQDPEYARALVEGGAPVLVRFSVGSTMLRPTPVFRVVAGPYDSGADVIQLSVVGETLIISQRLRADDFRLPNPDLHVEDGLEGLSRADTVEVEWRPRDDHGYVVRIGGQTPVSLGFTVGRSWNLIYPLAFRSETQLRLMDHGWMLILAAVVGWFSVGALGRTVSLLVLLAAAEGAARTTHLLPTPLSIHGAIVVGFVAGTALRWSLEMISDGWAPRPPDVARGGT